MTQGTNTTETYTYDLVGNRFSSLGVSPYNVNVSNELTSTPNTIYSYDSNGNMLTKIDSTGTTSYTWDFENRLTSVTLPGTGGTVSFKYDPFGRRIYKSSSSGTSIYAYDKDNLIEETNGAGAVVARYSQTQTIDEPLAMLRSGTTSYYNADGLGSVTSLSGSAGSLTQTYAYDSFGKQTSSSGSLTNPFQYTGRESDPETGIYYYRARYYDQNTGRFASEDPIRFKGGINFYAYVSNNPATITDPSGLLPSGVGPEACVYYDELCKRSCPPDAYACKAGQCCREFGNGPKQNCVRKCLIDQDKICTQNSPNSLQSCRLVNHVLCYSVCGFRPTGVPISCLKIALGF